MERDVQILEVPIVQEVERIVEVERIEEKIVPPVTCEV